jgi:hypothetical protein
VSSSRLFLPYNTMHGHMNLKLNKLYLLLNIGYCRQDSIWMRGRANIYLKKKEWHLCGSGIIYIAFLSTACYTLHSSALPAIYCFLSTAYYTLHSSALPAIHYFLSTVCYTLHSSALPAIQCIPRHCLLYIAFLSTAYYTLHSSALPAILCIPRHCLLYIASLSTACYTLHSSALPAIHSILMTQVINTIIILNFDQHFLQKNWCL